MSEGAHRRPPIVTLLVRLSDERRPGTPLRGRAGACRRGRRSRCRGGLKRKVIPMTGIDSAVTRQLAVLRGGRLERPSHPGGSLEEFGEALLVPGAHGAGQSRQLAAHRLDCFGQGLRVGQR